MWQVRVKHLIGAFVWVVFCSLGVSGPLPINIFFSLFFCPSSIIGYYPPTASPASAQKPCDTQKLPVQTFGYAQ
jgi:hypothetical protein